MICADNTDEDYNIINKNWSYKFEWQKIQPVLIEYTTFYATESNVITWLWRYVIPILLVVPSPLWVLQKVVVAYFASDNLTVAILSVFEMTAVAYADSIQSAIRFVHV